MSRSSGMGFGGVLLGVGIGWIIIKYLDVSWNIVSYLLIIAGAGIVLSSVFFKGQNKLFSELTGGLIGGLIIAVVFSSVFGLTNVFPFGSSITGSGDTVTRTFDYQGFKEIDASYGFNVEISQGNDYSISVSVDDNVVDRLKVSKSGDTLKIDLEPGNFELLNLNAMITMPSLYSAEFSTGARGRISGFSSTHDFNLDLSTGSWATIDGSAGDLTIDATGGSHFDLIEFIVDDVDAELSGGSFGSVYVGGTLDADITSGSHLSYYGNPELGDIHTSTGSTITPK